MGGVLGFFRMGNGTLSARLRIVGVVALHLSMGTVLIVNSVLAYLAEGLYPDLPYSTITLLSTLFALSALPGSLFGGFVAGRFVSFRTLSLGALLMLAGFGCLPFFVRDFTIVLAARVCGGFAQGILTTLYGGLVALTLLDYREATRVQGIGAVVGCLAGVFYQIAATSAVRWDVAAVWLVHLFLLVPIALVGLFMPRGRGRASSSVKGSLMPVDGAPHASSIPWGAWGIVAGYFVVLSFVNPESMSVSPVILGEHLGGATEVAMVSVLYTLGGIVAGLLYRRVLEGAKRWFFPGTLACIAAGALSMAFVPSVAGYGAGMILSGIGFYALMPGCTAHLSRMVDPAVFSRISGVFSAAGYLAQFAATPLVAIMPVLFGVDEPRNILVAGAFVLTSVAVVWGGASLASGFRKAD